MLRWIEISMIRTRSDATLLLLVCHEPAHPPLSWIFCHLSWPGGKALRISQQVGCFSGARRPLRWDGHQRNASHLVGWSFQRPRLAPVRHSFLSHCGRPLSVRLHPARRHWRSFWAGGPGQLAAEALMALCSATWQQLPQTSCSYPKLMLRYAGSRRVRGASKSSKGAVFMSADSNKASGCCEQLHMSEVQSSLA
jgi:hypothetical protein